jgi:hypothetical protein
VFHRFEINVINVPLGIAIVADGAPGTSAGQAQLRHCSTIAEVPRRRAPAFAALFDSNSPESVPAGLGQVVIASEAGQSGNRAWIASSLRPSP